MVERQLPSDSPHVDGVAVLHVSTGRYLGPALVLVGRDDAIVFETEEVAEQFVVRHASEPCYHIVTLAAHVAA